MRTPVQAPPARPPRFGLIAAAPVIEDGERWQQGFTFAPEGCGTSGRVGLACGGNTDLVEAPDSPAAVEGDPFVVWAGDKCSTFGYQARDWQGRARRQLEATRSYEIANELWTGDLLAEDPEMAGRALTDPSADVVTNGPTGLVAAWACLEAGLAVCGKGRQGMIHLTPQLLAHAVAAFLVTLSGTTWTSPGGHIVVADAGYTGDGPSDNTGATAGASQWIYGTSIIGLRLAPVEVRPASMEAMEMAQAMTPATNDMFVLAQQLVAYQWDECCHVAAEVNIGTCLIGGAS